MPVEESLSRVDTALDRPDPLRYEIELRIATMEESIKWRNEEMEADPTNDVLCERHTKVIEKHESDIKFLRDVLALKATLSKT